MSGQLFPNWWEILMCSMWQDETGPKKIWSKHKAQMSTNKSQTSTNESKWTPMSMSKSQTSTTKWTQMGKDKWGPANKWRWAHSKRHEQAVISTRTSQCNQVGTNRDRQKNRDKHKQTCGCEDEWRPTSVTMFLSWSFIPWEIKYVKPLKYFIE